jgi:hypothetical protein
LHWRRVGSDRGDPLKYRPGIIDVTLLVERVGNQTALNGRMAMVRSPAGRSPPVKAQPARSPKSPPAGRHRHLGWHFHPAPGRSWSRVDILLYRHQRWVFDSHILQVFVVQQDIGVLLEFITFDWVAAENLFSGAGIPRDQPVAIAGLGIDKVEPDAAPIMLGADQRDRARY